MARMYSRARGKSRSVKPAVKSKPTWVKYSAKEVELLIAKYHREGKTAAQIGTYLRDEYGIPDAKLVLGRGITKVLAEKKMIGALPEDVVALIRKSLMVRTHMEANKHDMTAKRGLIIAESKINKLVKYYKKTGVISADWKYDPSTANLLVG